MGEIRDRMVEDLALRGLDLAEAELGVDAVIEPGAALGLRTTAYLYIRMIAVYALVTIWNNLFFPDDEDELDPETRTRLHLNLGRDENGEMRTMRLQGSLSDIFSWFGIEDAAAALYEVERGRADLLDVLKAIAKAPINKIINGVTPTIKAPLEAAAGVQLFPDAFNARPVRDSWRNMFKTFSLENEYDLVMGNPSRGYGRSWKEAVIYKKDTGENNYNRIRTLAYNWLEREKGQEGYSAMTTPRSRAQPTTLRRWSTPSTLPVGLLGELM